MTTETEDKLDSARQQARAQLSSVRELVAWLEHAADCDDRDECEAQDDDIRSAMGYIGGEVADDEREQYHDSDQAEQRIHEDVLSVEVRSNWYEPGGDTEGPSEYRLLLCTGGPAVQILGDLDEHGEPERARLMCQDWFTPWEEVILESEETADLETFARCFYFGDG